VPILYWVILRAFSKATFCEKQTDQYQFHRFIMQLHYLKGFKWHSFKLNFVFFHPYKLTKIYLFNAFSSVLFHWFSKYFWAFCKYFLEKEKAVLLHCYPKFPLFVLFFRFITYLPCHCFENISHKNKLLLL